MNRICISVFIGLAAFLATCTTQPPAKKEIFTRPGTAADFPLPTPSANDPNTILVLVEVSTDREQLSIDSTSHTREIAIGHDMISTDSSDGTRIQTPSVQWRAGMTTIDVGHEKIVINQPDAQGGRSTWLIEKSPDGISVSDDGKLQMQGRGAIIFSIHLPDGKVACISG